MGAPRSTLSGVKAGASETDELAAENEQLRARVVALERELAEAAARANATVARAQERIYWLDRWHIDLNALLRRPAARHVPALIDGLRRTRHRLQRLKRRLAR